MEGQKRPSKIQICSNKTSNKIRPNVNKDVSEQFSDPPTPKQQVIKVSATSMPNSSINSNEFQIEEMIPYKTSRQPSPDEQKEFITKQVSNFNTLSNGSIKLQKTPQNTAKSMVKTQLTNSNEKNIKKRLMFSQSNVKDEIGQFYKNEKRKINIWTILFNQLNRSINEIYNMCELEAKIDYTKGVVETLETSIEDFKKQIHKFELLKENNETRKSIAWDFFLNNENNINNHEDYENQVEDIEGAENVDFHLLSQIVTEGKLSFDEAIVLIVRERALLINEEKNQSGSGPQQIPNNTINNASFISKFSIDNFLQEGGNTFNNQFNFDNEFDDNLQESNQNQSKRSRSMTPSSVSLVKLMNRLNWQLYKKHYHEQPKEELKVQQKFLNKQLKAELLREKYGKNKQDFLQKQKERYLQVRRNIQEKQNKQKEITSQKMDQADQRYEAHIKNIRDRAKDEAAKANEVAFIRMLEKQNMKLTLDEKLKNVRVRKLSILKKVQNRHQVDRQAKEDAVEKKRKAQQQEIKDKANSFKLKFEEAQKRKQNILKEKLKCLEDDLTKVKSVVEKKKQNEPNQKQLKFQNFLKKSEDKALQNLFKKPTFDEVLKNLESNKQLMEQEDKKNQNNSSFITIDSNDNDVKEQFQIQDDKEEKIYSLNNSFQYYYQNILEDDFSIIFDKPSKDKFYLQEQIKKSKNKKQKRKQIDKNIRKQQYNLNCSWPQYNQYREFAPKRKVKPKILKIPEQKEEIKKNSKTQVKKEQKITFTPKKITSQNDKEIDQQNLFKDEETVFSFEIRWCSICNLILQNSDTNELHLQQKSHKKYKMLYAINTSDDSNCILSFPEGSAGLEDLKTERINAMKKKSKTLKQKMQVIALKYETTSGQGKDSIASSSNKQRLQKLCVELEKSILPQIKDYDIVEKILVEVHKILDQKKNQDLIIMRQLKFIPLLMDICKMITVCHRNNISLLLKLLDNVISLVQIFCSLHDNRSYMLLSNRLLVLIDLLSWCLHRPTKFVYSLGFVPDLFNLLGRHIKHKLISDYALIKDDLVEYIFCSGFLWKLKQKFLSFNGGLDLSTSKGQVPLALLKSVGFLETLTSYSGFNVQNSPIFRLKQISETVIYLMKETDLIGIGSLLVYLLLEQGSSQKLGVKVLPQTVLSLTMISLKFLNNIARLNCELLQHQLSSKQNSEFIYHIFSYLLTYCIENFDKSEDVKDLLNELILLIGYFSLLNSSNQDVMARGEVTIIQKLAALPMIYFFDKRQIYCRSYLKCLQQILNKTKMTQNFINVDISSYSKNNYGSKQLIQYLIATKKFFFLLLFAVFLIIQEIFKQSNRRQVSIQFKSLQINKFLYIQLNRVLYKQYVNFNQMVKKITTTKKIQKIIFRLLLLTKLTKKKSQSISSTNSSQNSHIISSSQSEFMFELRFPRELWEQAASQFFETQIDVQSTLNQ